MDHPFRTAAVGGFNRQDVLSFLETTTREAAEKQQSLQTQLDEAREGLQQRDQELAELREKSGEVDELRTRCEETQTELEETRAQLEEYRRKSEEQIRQIVELKGQVQALKPGAEAYDSIKDRTAGVELEAHHRAQMVQEQAREEARQLRRQMEVWVQKVERDYDSLRTEVESTVAYAADQLNRAGESLQRVNQLLEEQDVALDALNQSYEETDPDRVKPPMPLEEN